MKTSSKTKKIVEIPSTATCTQIVKYLNKLGYSIREETWYDGLTLRSIDNTGDLVSINFDIHTMEFCCGAEEIGDLTINIYHDSIPKQVLKWFIRYPFLYLKEGSFKKVRREIRSTQYLFFSNGQGSCKILETSFRGWPHFKIAAKSVNPNSGNTITTYITT